ncbi:MAG: hypothetical protein NZ772_17320 [Cyanobacteria bacterium]|nr:hypothetical protein [Cyanobacteriota bacterium]MDW8203110.1 hypothetical protein [Cyanobacteriota bacterium SKYGB_h_bin112]
MKSIFRIATTSALIGLGLGWTAPTVAGPPLAVTTGNLNTPDINQCLAYMADVLRRVGLRDVTGQGNLVGGETSTVTVIIACLQGDSISTRWMVAVTGRDRVESERVRDNVVKSILR